MERRGGGGGGRNPSPSPPPWLLPRKSHTWGVSSLPSLSPPPSPPLPAAEQRPPGTPRPGKARPGLGPAVRVRAGGCAARRGAASLSLRGGRAAGEGRAARPSHRRRSDPSPGGAESKRGSGGGGEERGLFGSGSRESGAGRGRERGARSDGERGERLSALLCPPQRRVPRRARRCGMGRTAPHLRCSARASGAAPLGAPAASALRLFPAVGALSEGFGASSACASLRTSLPPRRSFWVCFLI